MMNDARNYTAEMKRGETKLTLSLTFILAVIVGVLIWTKKHHAMPLIFGITAYILGLITHSTGVAVLHWIGKFSSQVK